MAFPSISSGRRSQTGEPHDDADALGVRPEVVRDLLLEMRRFRAPGCVLVLQCDGGTREYEYTHVAEREGSGGSSES